MANDESSVETPEPETPPTDPNPAETPVEARSLYSHPLAAIGGALVLGGTLIFVLLVGIDLTSCGENAYRSLVTYFAVPAVAIIGILLFLLAMRIQVVNARKRGENVRFNLRIEPSNPRYMRSLWLFLGLGVVILITTGWAGFKGYETTDSVAFCGETCHTVMGPENITYQNSPHAQVPCAECHIGSGASFWVRSKIDGIRQVVKTMTNSYDRPIATPVESLRPAQQTCEQCHWPSQFYGRKLITQHYDRSDEPNSPWTINLAAWSRKVCSSMFLGSLASLGPSGRRMSSTEMNWRLTCTTLAATTRAPSIGLAYPLTLAAGRLIRRRRCIGSSGSPLF